MSTHLLTLPDDCLRSILSHHPLQTLFRLRQVCVRFCSIIDQQIFPTIRYCQLFGTRKDWEEFQQIRYYFLHDNNDSYDCKNSLHTTIQDDINWARIKQTKKKKNNTPATRIQILPAQQQQQQSSRLSNNDDGDDDDHHHRTPFLPHILILNELFRDDPTLKMTMTNGVPFFPKLHSLLLLYVYSSHRNFLTFLQHQSSSSSSSLYRLTLVAKPRSGPMVADMWQSINKLTALKHLTLFGMYDYRLPAVHLRPTLRRLTHFSLNGYSASILPLFEQLTGDGDDHRLSSLTLDRLSLPMEQLVPLLCATRLPQTLKRLSIGSLNTGLCSQAQYREKLCKFLQFFCEHFPLLERLHLRFALQIPLDQLFTTLSRLPRLTELWLTQIGSSGPDCSTLEMMMCAKDNDDDDGLEYHILHHHPAHHQSTYFHFDMSKLPQLSCLKVLHLRTQTGTITTTGTNSSSITSTTTSNNATKGWFEFCYHWVPLLFPALQQIQLESSSDAMAKKVTNDNSRTTPTAAIATPTDIITGRLYGGRAVLQQQQQQQQSPPLDGGGGGGGPMFRGQINYLRIQ